MSGQTDAHTEAHQENGLWLLFGGGVALLGLGILVGAVDGPDALALGLYVVGGMLASLGTVAVGVMLGVMKAHELMGK